MAKGEYIAILEGDDYWCDENKLQKQIDFLDKNSDFSFCCHDWYEIFEEENYKKLHLSDNQDLKNCSNKEYIELTLKNYFAYAKTLTIAYRSKYMDLKKFVKYPHFKDIFLFAYLLSKGRGAFFKDLHAVYRVSKFGIWSLTQEEAKLENNSYTYFDISKYFNHQNHFANLADTKLGEVYTIKKNQKDYAKMLKILKMRKIFIRKYPIKSQIKFYRDFLKVSAIYFILKISEILKLKKGDFSC